MQMLVIKKNGLKLEFACLVNVGVIVQSAQLCNTLVTLILLVNAKGAD